MRYPSEELETLSRKENQMNLRPTHYEAAAEAVLETLSTIDDRFSAEHANTIQNLSIMNSVRDSIEIGHPLVAEGSSAFVVSDGSSILAVATEAAARRYLESAPSGPTELRGHAIVAVYRDGPTDLFRPLPL
jgi:hypothetical protein